VLPGLPEEYSFNIFSPSQRLIFNNSGNLLEVQFMHHECFEFETIYQYIYE